MSAASERTHVVRAGETLSGIAHKYGVDWPGLARHNGVHNPSHLRVGSVLRIPRRSGAHSPATSRPPPPTLPALPAGPASGLKNGARLGDLSMRFETGFRPGQEAQAAAVVSGGVGDPGGVSYGAYQLASSASGGRQVQSFLTMDGALWRAKFENSDPTIPGGAFGAHWKEIAAGQAQAFFLAQHAYIERTHYRPVVEYVKKATQFDIDQHSRALQNVVWSMAVQHGRAPSLVARGVEELGPEETSPQLDCDRKLVNTLYDIREAYVDAIGLSNLRSRYKVERQDALQELGGR